MKTYFSIYGAVLFATFMACNSDPKPVIYENGNKLLLYNEFPFRASLEGEKVGPINYFMRPVRCILSKNMILVVDEKNEKLFHLMDEEFSILNSIGKPGDGPNELNEIPKALNHNFEKLGGFYYYLYGQNKVCKYILDESNRAFKGVASI
jgi:hypothetical protein